MHSHTVRQTARDTSVDTQSQAPKLATGTHKDTPVAMVTQTHKQPQRNANTLG